MNTTLHSFRVLIYRIDKPDPINAGLVDFHGQDLDTFDSSAARAALIADGRLVIGPTLVTFGDVLVPISAVERVTLSLEARSRPPTPEEAAAFKEHQAKLKAGAKPT